MREHDRRGHEFFGVIARETEHEALVAGALLGRAFALCLLRVDALGNVGRLRGDDVLDENFVGVEDVVVVRVTNLAHGIAHDLDVIEFRLGRDLAADDDDVALYVGLAGDAALLVHREAGVENGIGDGVGDLVGVTFTDGFGGKNEATKHGRDG